MVNFQFNFASIFGVVLIVLAVGLAFSPIAQRPMRTSRLVQNLVFALLYLIAGVILCFYGWRFDPLMQLSQVILVGLNYYWIVKDRSR